MGSGVKTWDQFGTSDSWVHLDRGAAANQTAFCLEGPTSESFQCLERKQDMEDSLKHLLF